MGARVFGRNRRRGAVLLLVLVTMAVLFVVVGQFSYSAALDEALAHNEVREAQATLDMQSAVAVFLRALQEDSGNRSLSVDLYTGTASISWESEAGKFNINTLRQEDNQTALQRFERLFQLLEEHEIVKTLGLASKITEFVLSSRRPILALGELLALEEVTPEVLFGNQERRGLAHYLTVYSDGSVNIGDAPPEVIAALDEGINNYKTIELLKRKLADPKAHVPNYVEVLLKRLRDSVTTESEAYKATITLRGRGVRREAEVAVRKEKDRYRVILYNEVDTSHERFTR